MDGYQAFVNSVLAQRSVAVTAAGAVTEATPYQNVIATTVDGSLFTASSGYTCKGGSTNCLVVRCAFQQNNDPDFTRSTVTYDGQPVILARDVQSASTGGAFIGYLMNPPNTANAVLEVNFLLADGSTAAVQKGVAVGLQELTGVNPADPIGVSDTVFADNSATDASMNVTPDSDNGWMAYAFGSFGSGSISSSADISELENASTGNGLNNVKWLFGEHDVGAAAPLTFDVTITGATEYRYGAAVVEFKP